MILIEKYTYSVFTRKTKHIKAVTTKAGYMVQECIVHPDGQHAVWVVLDDIIDAEPHIESILNPYIKDDFVANDILSLDVIKLKVNSFYGRESIHFPDYNQWHLALNKNQ